MQVLDNVYIAGCTAQRGGAVAIDTVFESGRVRLAGAVRLVGNRADGLRTSTSRRPAATGGGIFIATLGGALIIADGALLANNTAAASGGAVYVEHFDRDGTFAVSHAFLIGNTASSGGGISVRRTADNTILSGTGGTRSAVNGDDGQGLASGPPTTQDTRRSLTVISSLMSGNAALSGPGGAMEVSVEAQRSDETSKYNLKVSSI